MPEPKVSRQSEVRKRIDEHTDECSTCRRYLLDDDDWYQPCPVLDALYDEHDIGRIGADDA